MRTTNKVWIISVMGVVASLLLAVPASANPPNFEDGNVVRFTVDNAADIGDRRPGDGRCEIEVEDTKEAKAIIPGSPTPTIPSLGGGGAPSKTIPTLYPPISPPPSSGSAGRCTLRAAVEESNANTKEPHLVTVPSSLGVYRLTEGALEIRGQLKLVRDFGPGSKRAAINAGHRSRIFVVSGPGTFLGIDGLFLAQGSAGANSYCCDGGAIYVGRGGEVELDRSVIVNGRARDGGAVAVDTGGSLRARWTSFETNHAANYGGAISARGYAFLDRSSVYKNTALLGGGIYLASEAGIGFWMENSSVIDNTASVAGGGVFAAARSFNGMVHSTVTGNAAPDGGGYYYNGHEEMLFAYSILAGNIDTEDPTALDASPDCYGEMSTDGSNLFGAISGFGAGDSTCHGYDVSEDIIGTTNNPLDPGLEFVRISTDANNRGDGGELAYSRPSFRSPALDAVPAGRCTTNHDMIRSNARSGEPCDLGAIER